MVQQERRQAATWRRLIVLFGLLVVVAVVFSVARDSARMRLLPEVERESIQWGLAIVWFVVGVLLIRQLRRTISYVTRVHTNADARVQSLVDRAISGVGYAFVLVVGLHLVQVKIGSILVGGAVTGVIVGVGAQSTLANLIASMVLFTLRPFQIGQYVTVRTYLFGGVEYSGTVVDINWYHTILQEGDVRRILPNSSVIGSAITVGANVGNKLCVVPLPYTTPFRAFEERVAEVTGGQASVSIKEFGSDTYVVQVQLPARFDLELIREAIADFRREDER